MITINRPSLATLITLIGLALGACDNSVPTSVFSEKHLATVSQEVEKPLGLTFNAEISQVAYAVEQSNKKHRVILGDKRSEEFDKVSRPVFSPKDNKLAYGIEQNGGAFMIVGDARGPKFIAVGDPVFSPDGNKLAYRARTTDSEGDSKHVVVVDHQIGQMFYMVDEPIFTPDGSKVAYVAIPKMADILNESLFGKKGILIPMILFVGDQKITEQQGIQDPAFSPDGRRLAYIVVVHPGGSPLRSKMFAVVDGQKRPQFDFDEARFPVFSPDGVKVAYIANSGTRWFVVVEDQQGPRFDELAQPVFSPNGSKVAYAAKQGGKWFIVDGDKRGQQFDKVGQPVFNSDGGKIAYRAKRGAKWLIVVGDRVGPEFDQVGEPRFSPDGKKVAYGVQQGRELRRKVMDVE